MPSKRFFFRTIDGMQTLAVAPPLTGQERNKQALVEAKWEAILEFKTKTPEVRISDGGTATCAFCAAYFHESECQGCPVF